MSYKIGYVDEDINQVKLYRRKLKDHGFDVVGYTFEKGMTVDDLMRQVYESDIDLLMIDFKLNESNVIAFNGDAVERDIYVKKPLFPHIIFTNKVDQAEPEVDDLRLIVDKEDVTPSFDDGDDTKAKRFVNLLTKSIEQYKGYIDQRKSIIARLLKKEETSTLNATEKDLLLSTQKELQYLDKTATKELPEQLASIEKLDDVSKVRHEAEAYFNSLLANNTDESTN